LALKQTPGGHGMIVASESPFVQYWYIMLILIKQFRWFFFTKEKRRRKSEKRWKIPWTSRQPPLTVGRCCGLRVGTGKDTWLVSRRSPLNRASSAAAHRWPRAGSRRRPGAPCRGDWREASRIESMGTKTTKIKTN
jgi:hypothetical protein